MLDLGRLGQTYFASEERYAKVGATVSKGIELKLADLPRVAPTRPGASDATKDERREVEVRPALISLSARLLTLTRPQLLREFLELGGSSPRNLEFSAYFCKLPYGERFKSANIQCVRAA